MLVPVIISLFAVIAVLCAWRYSDRRSDTRACRILLDRSGPATRHFDAALVAGLPEAARRYFEASIRPGALLMSAVEIEMRGQLGLGTKTSPNYRPMRATQLLVPPDGLVWRLQAGAIAGSDGVLPDTSWTRFWLFGVLPVVRVGGSEDHRRSAFGRVVAEAAFWSPASLLPGDHVRWEPIRDDTARAIVRFGDLEQAVDISIDEQGLPSSVRIDRWSNENEAREYRWQPFGGTVSDFIDVEGYRLPTRVDGGNHFGTDAYFPFYRAEVARFRFVQAASPTPPAPG